MSTPKKTTALNLIESIIDQTSVADILHAIESICFEKAAHIRENWQDEASALQWDKAGTQIGLIGDATEV